MRRLVVRQARRDLCSAWEPIRPVGGLDVPFGSSTILVLAVPGRQVSANFRGLSACLSSDRGASPLRKNDGAGAHHAIRPYYHVVYWKVRLDFPFFTRFSQTAPLVWYGIDRDAPRI